jgi:phenylacetic acid degradation operon negative regulatory protein
MQAPADPNQAQAPETTKIRTFAPADPAIPVIHPAKKRIDDFLQQRRVQAGSLIISVFGDAVLPRGGRIWLGSLIDLLKPLDVSDRLVRTAIFRLAKEQWLRTEAHGRRADYMLTPAGQRRFEEASRHIYSSHAPTWDHRWRLILVVGELDPKQRERLRGALFWQGFGSLGSDCFVHPSTDLTTAFDALMADGMSDLLKYLMPQLAANAGFSLSANDADMVRRAWDLEHLGLAYADFVSRYQPVVEALRHDVKSDISDEQAFLLRTLLIHDYRRLLLRDPELPDVLLPGTWPGQKARLLCKELYRRLLAPSERHLDLHMRLANGSTPAALPLLAERFQSVDPLTPPL